MSKNKSNNDKEKAYRILDENGRGLEVFKVLGEEVIHFRFIDRMSDPIVCTINNFELGDLIDVLKKDFEL